MTPLEDPNRVVAAALDADMWSTNREDAISILGATRGDGVDARARFIIFGSFPHRSLVILLVFVWDRCRQLYAAVRVDIPLHASGNTLGVGSSAKKGVPCLRLFVPTKIEDSRGHDTIQFIRYLDYRPAH